MSALSEHHKTLNEDGIGKCSVPMYMGGMPAGFCDRPAYGERSAGTEWWNYAAQQMMRHDGKYAGHMSGLACSCHGGPSSRVFKDGNQFCAVLPDFENLQDSPTGFGDTEEQARAALAKAGAA
jgi:hypothetical protein